MDRRTDSGRTGNFGRFGSLTKTGAQAGRLRSGLNIMKIEENIPLIDEILENRKTELGDDFAGYKNHVCRMVNFCLVRKDFGVEEREKIIIAGAFHDLGIWAGAGKTLDYLPPSIDLAKEYLLQNGLDEWSPEIVLMIDMHHKLRKFENENYPLTEVFRRGDLVDFSLGLIKCGLPRTYIKAVKKTFPNRGFHKTLVGLAGRRICRHPLNPLPVFKY
jgi:hypothetical protein